MLLKAELILFLTNIFLESSKKKLNFLKVKSKSFYFISNPKINNSHAIFKIIYYM